MHRQNFNYYVLAIYMFLMLWNNKCMVHVFFKIIIWLIFKLVVLSLNYIVF